MPPKKGQDVSKKQVQKEAKQLIEDKTFGLKNKNKSRKVQEYVQQVQKNVNNKAKMMLEQNKPKQCTAEQVKAQKEEERKQQQIALLRQTLKQPKVPPGDDPKSYMCIYFQYGCCDKGDKCRFSHGEKPKVMTEQEIREEKLRREVEREQKRMQEMGFYSEDMGQLDIHREMRDQVMEFRAKQVSQRSGREYFECLDELRQQRAERLGNFVFSDKHCDYFIQACRDSTIGFGWQCPNERDGKTCQYKHWIPKDFQLFKKEEMDEDLDYEELEDRIEREREAITAGTPVTAETFAVWKAARTERQAGEAAARDRQREQDGSWTGRQIFERGLYRRGEAEDDAPAAQDDALIRWREQRRQRAEEERRIEAAQAAQAAQAADE